MQWRTLSIMLAIVTTSCTAEKPDATKADLAKLQGTWRVVAYRKNGINMPPEYLKLHPTLTIKGNEYTWSSGTRPGTIHLNAGTQPKQVEYTITAGPDKGKVEKGIYVITQDGWRDCFTIDGKERPKEFASSKDSQCTLVSYEREK